MNDEEIHRLRSVSETARRAVNRWFRYQKLKRLHAPSVILDNEWNLMRAAMGELSHDLQLLADPPASNAKTPPAKGKQSKPKEQGAPA